ncbi:SRPBCC family protein [Baekduia soli]|uniref:SRPBCC family protein n=1 Tax=Baekduia soli TaxID=496014 RepID=A0A5B8UAP1_9ACTN|nr:SRPBCC family protein [Baekduia soli]QEC50140.1 SRPBCC family protein [Baekduia soli]
MGRVRAEVEVAALASVVEELWYDTSRWPTFVDGLAHVAKVEGDWPRDGRVVWDARPGGRGRVIERVVAYEARAGQTVAVEDERITGTQRLAFTPTDRGCRVRLELDYAVKDRRPLMAVVDLLFVRRPMGDALRRTLVRLRREVDAADLVL